VSLLEEVIEAHGGRKRWSRAKEVHAHVRSGGLLMRSKGQGRCFRDYRLSVDTGEPRAVFEPYPREGSSGVFTANETRLVDAEGGVTEERQNPREAFSGSSGLRRRLRWDSLDALYFAGYAMWNYLTIPFLFVSEAFEREGFVQEGEPLETDSGPWRRLDVRFPEDIPTHSRDQCFYFDAQGLLRRHDYTPEVVASFANAAHMVSGHREVDGLVFGTHRQVFPKAPGGRPLPGPTVVWIDLDSISVS
jgi:hypothetical protein